MLTRALYHTNITIRYNNSTTYTTLSACRDTLRILQCFFFIFIFLFNCPTAATLSLTLLYFQQGIKNTDTPAEL